METPCYDTSTITTDVCPDCIRSAAMMTLAADDGPGEIMSDGLGFKLLLSCGDTFHYACGDAEEVPAGEVVEVARIWREQGYLGLVVWIARKRGMKPVVEYCETLEDNGIALPEGLQDNPENALGLRWSSRRGI